jgi:hypothetical protein
LRAAIGSKLVFWRSKLVKENLSSNIVIAIVELGEGSSLRCGYFILLERELGEDE